MGIASSLRDRSGALGTWVQMNSPETCELAAASGFDFVVIDMEHGSFDLGDAVHMIRAVECGGADPIVRVPSDDPAGIKRVLDAGAAGVLVPGIRTAAQAAAVVAAARYEPRGTRGACPCTRSTGHGRIPWPQARRRADENVLVWLLIEHPDAIADIEAIAETGPDALALGPFDLAMSMGLDGDHRSPEVRAALDTVIAAARARDIEVMATALEESTDATATVVESWRAAGCRIVTALVDRLTLLSAYREMYSKLQ